MLRPSRRRLLAALLCALPFAILGDEQAQAFMMHRGGMATGGGGGTLLTTMTLINETASADTPMWSEMRGHVFIDGDLPLVGGQLSYPVFKIGGVTVPYSCSVSPSTHPSGCMRHVWFVLLMGNNFTIPAQVAGVPGTLLVSIYSGGTAPAPSSRNMSDFTTADLKSAVTIMDNDTTGLSTYVASLNDAVTAAKVGNYLYGDGASGKFWFLQSDYKNGTTKEGNLTSGWYAMSMQDSSGNFGGILFQAFASLPWADATPSTKLWKSFSSCQLLSGASLIRNNVTVRTNTQTIVPANPGGNNQWTATGNLIETGQLIRLSSSSGVGNLPSCGSFTGSIAGTTLTVTAISPAVYVNTLLTGSGVSTGTIILAQLTGPAGGIGTYQVSISQTVSSTTISAAFTENASYFAFTGDRDSVFANKMTVGYNSGSIIQSALTIIPSTSGAGTITATAYPFLVYYGTMFFSGTNGKYDFVQGGGSVSAVTVSRCQINTTYWMASQVIPKYDQTFGTPTSSASTAYYVNSSAEWTHQLNGTSERIEIGVMPSPYVRHLYTQAAVDEQNVRAGGLVCCNMPIRIWQTSTGGYIPFNNGHNGSGTNYSGMSALQPTGRWSGSSSSNASTAGFFPATPNLQCTFDVGSDPQHRPAFAFYPFLFTGQPEYKDLLANMVNTDQASGYQPGTTTVTINSGTYAPTGTGGNSGSRIRIISGTTRWGIYLFGASQRAEAWMTRDLCSLIGILAANDVTLPYYTDVLNDNMAFVNDVIALAPTTYASTNGLFYPQATSSGSGGYYVDVWMQSYMLQAAALGYGLTGNSTLLTMMNKLNAWWAHVVNTFGAYSTGAEEHNVRVAADPGAVVANDNLVGFIGPTMTWNDAVSTSNFTMNVATTGTTYTPSVNDVIIWTTPNPPSENTTPLPTGLSYFTQYFIVSVTPVSGTTYTVQLSATLGGSAVTFTGAQTNKQVWTSITNSPGTGTWAANSNTGYILNLYRSVLLTQNRTASFDAGALSLIAARQIAPSSLLTEPKYAFAA